MDERAPPAADSPLFPTPDERLRWDDELTRSLADALDRVRVGSVMPVLDLPAFGEALAEFDFASSRPFGGLLSWTIGQMETGVVQMTHPGYFGLFNPAPTFPSQCADRIVAAFNPQLATSTTSPAAVAIEAHVIRAVARRAGLPEGATGNFTTGGTEANCTALLCALTRSNPAFAADGIASFGRPPVFYVSRESHLAWLKIAHQTGIGRSAARLVETDGQGRMDPAALARILAADQAAGRTPVMVAATAGTTNAGMIDPLAECADLAQSAGAWYHVDAAWGGALIASDRLKAVLAGMERADSVTIDAHKWFATTMGCGMFLTRDRKILGDTFNVSTGFMPSNRPDIDPYVTSMQWSRRFLGLRLFLSLAAAGWSGHARHVEHSIALIALLRSELAGRGWIIANDSPMAVLCVEPPAGSNDAKSIVSSVLASGKAWIAVARFEGRDVIRICATHGESDSRNVTELVEALQRACDASP